MYLIKLRLEREYGMRVSLFNYPSISGTLDDNAAALAAFIRDRHDDSAHIIGHSLGCATVLRFLESLSEHQKVGGVIMVAGFLDDRGDSEISTFFKKEFNYERIRMHSHRFVSIHSDNDPSLKPNYLKHSYIFLSKLKAKIIIIPDGGHFSMADNCFEFPEVVNEVINLNYGKYNI